LFYLLFIDRFMAWQFVMTMFDLSTKMTKMALGTRQDMKMRRAPGSLIGHASASATC